MRKVNHSVHHRQEQNTAPCGNSQRRPRTPQRPHQIVARATYEQIPRSGRKDNRRFDLAVLKAVALYVREGNHVYLCYDTVQTVLEEKLGHRPCEKTIWRSFRRLAACGLLVPTGKQPRSRDGKNCWKPRLRILNHACLLPRMCPTAPPNVSDKTSGSIDPGNQDAARPVPVAVAVDSSSEVIFSDISLSVLTSSALPSLVSEGVIETKKIESKEDDHMDRNEILRDRALKAIKLKYPNIVTGAPRNEFTDAVLIGLFAKYEGRSSTPPLSLAFYVTSFEGDCCAHLGVDLNQLPNVQLKSSRSFVAKPGELCHFCQDVHPTEAEATHCWQVWYREHQEAAS